MQITAHKDLHLSYADLWENELTNLFKAAEETRMGVNPDVNSGNPIGMGIGAACMPFYCKSQEQTVE
jgi:hypothetical protein